MKDAGPEVSDLDKTAGAQRIKGIIYPEENLSPVPNVIAGFQHVIAMSGSTVLGPLLMGFDPNVAIFFSGIATLLFFVIVRGRIPSYLGSSFAFIAAVITLTSYPGTGPNLNIAVALGGIIAAGAAYAVIGLVVMLIGYGWVDRLMPPVVTGTIVAIIGLNLAPVAVGDINKSDFNTAFGLFTILLVGLSAAYLPQQFLRRIPILIGGGVAYVLYYFLTNLRGMGAPIDFAAVANAPWLGLPHFVTPVFTPQAIWLIVPVAVVLAAENLGHVKAVAIGTGRNLDPLLGRAFFADGLATMLSASGGGTGVTTYAENIGVMAVTRNYSARTFVVAGIFAILIGLSPKFGAIVHTIPIAIIGGLAFIVFGLISATAIRIWVQDRTDFTKTSNLLPVGVALVIGAGNLSISYGSLTLGGIALGTLAALVLYHLLKAGFD
jgi:putative pyrimidine permease RutG